MTRILQIVTGAFLVSLIISCVGCTNERDELSTGLFEGYLEAVNQERTSMYVFIDSTHAGSISIPSQDVESFSFSSLVHSPGSIQAELGSDPVQLEILGQFSENAQVLSGSIKRPGRNGELRFKLAPSGTAQAKELMNEALFTSIRDTTQFFPDAFENIRAEELKLILLKRNADNDFWNPTDPATAGLNEEAFAEHLELCKQTEADGCLVAYRGQIIQEWYGPFYPSLVHNMSSMKSWTSILTGMLIDDGKIESVDDLVSQYIPEWEAGSENDVTIRHLLTMTSGLLRMDSTLSVAYHQDDASGYVMTLPLGASPGMKWSYSNEAVQLLSPILERAAGMPLDDYARIRLFEPLGMISTSAKVDGLGKMISYADARTTLRDMARIGELMRNEGQWEGEQIVSAEWVQVSTSPISDDLNSRYGFLWWVYPELPGFASLGFKGTDSYIIPELEIVVVRVQNSGRAGLDAQYRKELVSLIPRFVQSDQQ